MALTSGTRLGSYEVLAQIGAGGMGEVYRARDSKLGRDVAIKVLPANFVNDPERLARFQRQEDDGGGDRHQAELFPGNAEGAFRGTVPVASDRFDPQLRRVSRWPALPDAQAHRTGAVGASANQRRRELV